MARVLVFQHVPYEPLGLLDPKIRALKHRIRYVNFGREPKAQVNLDNYDALVVLGGPMNIGQELIYPHLIQEQFYIRQAAEKGIPILGICLGAQLIASSFGAAVYPAATAEIGWQPIKLTNQALKDPVFSGLSELSRVFQWHGYTFDLPANAVRLAENDNCPNQGFKIGENIYGLQFHLEANLALIQRWLRLPQHQSEMANMGQTGAKEYAEQVWKDTLYHYDFARHAADRAFSAFLSLLPQVSRVVQLKHR